MNKLYHTTSHLLAKAFLCLACSILVLFCCGIRVEQFISTTEGEVSPEISAPAPTEPSVPETSIPTTSIPTTSEPEMEPEETLPPESEGPSTEELFWQKCAEEYPVATEIWLQMKSYGWTDAACAGIMGNLMRETGGDSMAHLRPNLINKRGTHYGLCQWAQKYYPDIWPTEDWTPTIAEQLDYLRYTINNQRTLHHVYGFTEEYLFTVTDYREAAKVFCDGYEKPNESTVRREDNAEKAWNYFVLRVE